MLNPLHFLLDRVVRSILEITGTGGLLALFDILRKEMLAIWHAKSEGGLALSQRTSKDKPSRKGSFLHLGIIVIGIAMYCAVWIWLDHDYLTKFETAFGSAITWFGGPTPTQPKPSSPEPPPVPQFTPEIRNTPFAGHTVQYSVTRRIKTCINGRCTLSNPLVWNRSIYVADNGSDITYVSNANDSNDDGDDVKFQKPYLVTPETDLWQMHRIVDFRPNNVLMVVTRSAKVTDLGGDFSLDTVSIIAAGNGCGITEEIVESSLQSKMKLIPVIRVIKCTLVPGKQLYW